MPTLNWIGKEAIVSHDKEVPFRLLKKVKSSSVGENSQNLIIHGDNLEALKSLLPYYQGKVKCIYIDPPYNTGNEGWVYNDRVNSPKIKKWLGKVVGGEAEDLCRHDKWLCMMYPRLRLLRELLSDDGVIFVSIDDYEVHNMRNLLDEIFGIDCFISTIIWKKKVFDNNDNIPALHEYILAYSKIKNNYKLNLLERTPTQLNKYKNPDNDPRGLYNLEKLTANTEGGRYSKATDFPIFDPKTGKKFISNTRNWRFGKETIDNMIHEGRIDFNGKLPRYRLYLNEIKQGVAPNTWWDDCGQNLHATKELQDLFGQKEFNTPKPTTLIKKIIKITTKKNDLILDSFAGSGTTGHAVLDLNKEDGGNRKFILIELEDYAKDITAERVKRAIEKYDYKTKDGQKEGFEYCELSKPLFDEKGKIDGECTYEQLATYIYFTETNTNLEKKQISGNLIGEHNDTEFYLMFEGKGKNILNKKYLKNIPKNQKKKIIYADKCLIDQNILKEYNIVFKQIPYEVKVY